MLEERIKGGREGKIKREAGKGEISLTTDMLKKKTHNLMTFDHLMFMGKIGFFSPYQGYIMVRENV